MRFPPALTWVARHLLDFALPPRCAGCGAITAEVGLFCTACWPKVEFLGSAADGCDRCGGAVGPGGDCAACPEGRQAIDRLRAAVAYGDIARSLAIRLKYGRKTAVAGTMATYMRRPLSDLTSGALLVPVPLHRGRLGSRGFNQAALIATALGKAAGLAADTMLLQRVRKTPKLKGMSPRERRNTVKGAFALRGRSIVKDRDIILVDDVITTGSTAEECARLLKREGARTVELIAWARVVR
jgi:ComF family protein